MENPPSGEEQELLHLLIERIPPGVDEAAYVKATWLSAIAQGQASSPLVSPLEATRLLGTMVGGYNVAALIELLQHSDTQLAGCAAEGLSRTLLVYDAFNEDDGAVLQQPLRQAGGGQLGRQLNGSPRSRSWPTRSR